jgi:hypothetical protein
MGEFHLVVSINCLLMGVRPTEKQSLYKRQMYINEILKRVVYVKGYLPVPSSMTAATFTRALPTSVAASLSEFIVDSKPSLY